MTTKTPYFYIIRHKITKKYYAGCKINSESDSSNFMTEKGYKTTSKIIKSLIKKDGLQSFEILRIKHFEFPDQALSYESRFLTKINAAEHDLFFNRHNGGKNFVNKGGYKLSESTKDKMKKPKSRETIEKQNKNKRERPKEVYEKAIATRRRNNPVWHNEEMREIIRKNNISRFASEESRIDYSKKMKEHYKNNPVSEETKAKHRELSSGENNPMFGKKHNEETKEKMRLAWERRRNKNISNQSEINISNKISEKEDLI